MLISDQALASRGQDLPKAGLRRETVSRPRVGCSGVSNQGALTLGLPGLVAVPGCPAVWLTLAYLLSPTQPHK